MATVYACSDKPAGQTPERPGVKPPPPVVKVGVEPAEAGFVEQDSFNIPYWLEHGMMDRILVRLSGFDGLAPVDDATMARLKALAAEGKYNDLWSAGDKTTGKALYGAENVVYVANRLGIVKEAVWVVPIFQSITDEDFAGFKDYLSQSYPGSKDDIKALKLAGNTAAGIINGVPVRMVGLQDLVAPPEPVIFDVESSFFASLYRDEKDTSSMKFIAGMFNLLRKAGLSADAVSISASSADGKSSLKLRVFGVYLKELLHDPAMVDAKAPPELWSERAAAWKADQNDPEQAVRIFKGIIKKYPEDAAARYDLAELYFRLGELDACSTELDGAAKLDPAYSAAYEQFRDYLNNSGKPDIAAQFYSRKPAS